MKLSKQFDAEVMNWASELKKVCLFICFLMIQRLMAMEPLQHSEHNVTDQAQHSEFEFVWLKDMPTDEESDYSIGDVSVISDCESNDDNVDVDDEGEDATEVDMFQISQDGLDEVEFVSQDTSDPGSLAVRLFEPEPSSIRESVQTEVGVTQERSIACISGSNVTSVSHDSCATPTDGYGYVIVIDNLDMNVRRSFQRIKWSTESMHFCHAYVVLNRFDTSGLEDRPQCCRSYTPRRE